MRLALLGDVMLGRGVNETLQTEPPRYPWGDTLPLLRTADARIANLECVLSDRGQPWQRTPKIFHFRSAAQNVAVLCEAGIDAVALANNHTLDYEVEALLDTLAILDRAGIAHAGAGPTLAAASAPALVHAAGARVGLLAFTDNEPGWAATDTMPGILHVPVDLTDAPASALLEATRRAASFVDLLVVSAHWGGNWGYEPPAEHRNFAKALIDAGAGVVFGHSSHVCRGVEVYRGRLILYGAGDFVDDYAVDPVERNDRSFIFLLDAEPGASRTQLRTLAMHPTVIRNRQARLAVGLERDDIARNMLALCKKLGTAPRLHDGIVRLDIA